MKKITIRLCRMAMVMALAASGTLTASADVLINKENFPDSEFRFRVQEEIDPNRDGTLTDEEIAGITEIYFYESSESKISDMKGIEHFTALTKLICNKNYLKSLDLSANTKLKYLNCRDNHLTSLDVSANTALTYLDCTNNFLKSIDVRAKTALTELRCSKNQLKSLDVSGCTSMVHLSCSDNKIETLKLNGAKAMTHLYCSNNSLKSLDLSENTALLIFDCKGNQLTSLDLSANTAMTTLYCMNNSLASLDLSENKLLASLDCSDNQLTSLDVSANTALTSLYCMNSQLESLNLSNNTRLRFLYLKNSKLTSLDLSKTEVQYYNLTDNKREVDVNFKYEKDGKTYYYIDMAADELHNKLGEGFCVENVISWTGATVGKTPAGANALIFEGQPTSVTYVYNTKAPQSEAVDGNMTVTLNLNYDNMPTAVGDIDADEAVRIYSAAGMIRIVGSEAEARVYDMTGQCIYAGLDREVAVSAGLYIVKVGTTTKKIAVR